MTRESYDLRQVVEQIIRFRDERDWKQFHRPKELAAAIAIEAGELQELFLWRGEEHSDDLTEEPSRVESIADELADVMIFTLLLSNELKIPVADAILAKLTKNAERYPIEKHKGIAKKSDL
jgi:NTP pyrophosphatase (non-canonical NTP hydrolase)